MKKILILGSTGSIGTNALELIRNNREQYQVVGISGNKNIDLLKKQIEEFKPISIYVGSEQDAIYLKKEYSFIKEVYFGENGLAELSKNSDYDIILTAVSGAIGIDATVEAIKRGKRIALANKETMVSAGIYINKLLKEYPKAEIVPVDSEHSALFQSLQGFKKENLKKLIITASGGTFRGKDLAYLENVTVEQALKHPNWSMGKKITIDSSTLVNKGLEVIEAHELFNVDYDDIEVVIHPQSIIHSMVEYVDGSIIAQMGVANMKTPILYAFTYPEKEYNSSINFLDLIKNNNLTFEEADRKVLKGIDLAYRAGRTGDTMPTVFNASNEIAVELFMKKQIKFLDIYRIIEEAMNSHQVLTLNTDNALNVIKEVDREIRKKVREQWEK
ncbi:1-deoxy-D-xylulose-5-phosphate reductoisomerase [Fusobacterium nucleatum]|uniref:1-deoxy-D-xylulose 5-phosphate reductoisomerase n=1 Tax=Fusobacterium nucleatum subsp. nucleatum TaxID=76856 RepID=A0A0M4RZX4_FUSNC|nr:1-deoxy-D-xylulose-5-phosphate reductoisomerase [Fusobacterium nucleatum]ALF25766.1 1-deoxy-D-xylulose 5-phosphate reductoisomerase [Fusobacterium nucleatum subsp. nucleatum]KUL99194.1 1-deoxy-D-xylulose 5-phosphate reductoisomerase [Fusobacterium nucleatum subsp. nucleatum]